MSHISRGDLHAYLDGALGHFPQDVAAEIREHLSACLECARRLEEERELRRNASEILAKTSEVPVDLIPFEELVTLAGRPAKPEGARSSLSSRLRPLRLAATIVISLGAGWLARDLTGPAIRVENRVAAEVAQPLGGSLRGADETEVGRSVDQVDARLAEVQLKEEPTAGAAFVDTDEVLPESASPVSLARSQPELRLREARSSTVAEVAVEDVAAERERSIVDEPLASPSAPRENVAQARGLASVLEQEGAGVRRSLGARDALADALADDRSDAGPDAGPDVSTPLLIPGIRVLDVRFTPRAGASGVSVVVTQEMTGGQVVELRFVPVAGDGFENRDVITEVLSRDTNEAPGDALPEGWNEVVRSVPGGVATLRGPFAESELSRLLGLAVAAR
jgi:hypothetical protein